MTVLVPCGRTMGHGQICEEGYLCEHCAEIERLRRNQMSTSYVSIAQAAALQAQEADAQLKRAEILTDKCTKFTEALMRAMTLIEELMRENSRLCAASGDPPSVRLFAAKASWDASMHRLLGDKGDEPPSPSEKREESDNESEVKGEAK